MPSGPDPVERVCPYCGSIVTSEDFFCRACHRRFELRGAETDPTKLAAVPEGSVLSLRNPLLSAFLACAGPGLGQFYNGDTLKGLVVNAIYLPVVFGYLQLPVAYWLVIVTWGISLLDAPVTSWRINHLATDFSGPSLLFWAGLAILTGLLAWYLVSGEALVWLTKFSPVLHFLLD